MGGTGINSAGNGIVPGPFNVKEDLSKSLSAQPAVMPKL
jgi:hypothetical protein